MQLIHTQIMLKFLYFLLDMCIELEEQKFEATYDV